MSQKLKPFNLKFSLKVTHPGILHASRGLSAIGDLLVKLSWKEAG